MIVFDLQCQDSGDVFEGWFRSNADYEDQLARGLLECPACRSRDIAKAPMAPKVPRRSGADVGEALAALSKVQSEMLRDSEWVGDQFAEQARAMHLGEAEPSKIHGQATAAEARALSDEGVAFAPLPLPVVPPSQVN